MGGSEELVGCIEDGGGLAASKEGKNSFAGLSASGRTGLEAYSVPEGLEGICCLFWFSFARRAFFFSYTDDKTKEKQTFLR